MNHTMYAVDTQGQTYIINNKDKRISFGTLMHLACERIKNICIISDGHCMVSAPASSWTAPAYVHAINPDARIDRTVKDTIETIIAMNPIEISI